jgi:signal transduction histidine kinase
MQFSRNGGWVYGLLAAVWLVVMVWQRQEHSRVREEARAVLVNRAKDISTTLGIVLRSQRRFGGVVSKERLEASMTELVRHEKDEILGIALLNASGELVASTGELTDIAAMRATGTTESWDAKTVTLINPVDLGTNVTYDIEGTNPPIVLSRQDFTSSLGTNRMGPPPGFRPGGPRPDRGDGPPREDDRGDRGRGPMPPPDGPDPNTNTNWNRQRFGRPRWMSEEEFLKIREKQGVHSFVVVLSNHGVLAVAQNDFWLRSIICLLATVSVAGTGLAWRSLGKSSELQLRLVRASEVNSRLKEMNLAAAGLAHETRNPLNIIRGMAQMMSKDVGVSTELRDCSKSIVEEVDKVTAQLNEFINYSRPRDLRPARIDVKVAAGEVVRMLGYDLEEKHVAFEVLGEPLVAEADEQMFRQLLFNLVLNAIQAVGESGTIQIVCKKSGPAEAVLEVRDDGPGVLPEHRTEIFKPYFTTHQKGTGLGLAVVWQIVQAHGWEIGCGANEPRGAVFRISHLKVLG